MAEENQQHANSTQFFGHGSDDVSALRVLLHSVKGISPISLAPAVEANITSDAASFEQFQFE